MSSGWIMLHRQLLEWEWYDDVNTSRLFIHCLLRANHSDNKWRGIDIKRGSFLTSLESLSKETKLTISQIRTSLNKLISTRELTSKSQARSRVITVIEYNLWQANDSNNNKLVASSSQNDSKIVTTNNNDNNDKEDKKPLVDKSTKFKFDEDDLRFAEWFQTKLLELNPNHPEPSSIKKWADDIRKLRTIDKRTYPGMSDLFLWVCQDDFWCTNILSPGKFRKQWGQLTIKMNADTNKNNSLSIAEQSAADDWHKGIEL